MLQIHGQVPANAAKFALNLQNGPGTYPNDILFHFNPRYNDGAPYVCKNNRRGGAWGAEERDSSNPIARGSNFEILVLAEPSEIKVCILSLLRTQYNCVIKLVDSYIKGCRQWSAFYIVPNPK